MRRFSWAFGLVAVVGLFALVVWNANRGYRSETFSSTEFHAASTSDCSAVFTKFTDYLRSQGFRKTQSPSEWDSWAGVHGEGASRIWFAKGDGEDADPHIYVDLDPLHVRTSIKWGVYGNPSAARESKSRALRFAIEVDDWFASLEESNILPDRLQQGKRSWFVEELAQVD